MNNWKEIWKSKGQAFEKKKDVFEKYDVVMADSVFQYFQKIVRPQNESYRNNDFVFNCYFVKG